MFKLIKKNIRIIALFLFISILFPIIILTSSSFGFIPLDIGKEIVGYGGSLLGGLIGIVGIYI